MEAGGAARSIEHGGLQVVEDHGPGTAAEELQRVNQAAVELGLALRERELDEHQPAVAEHGHEHRNLAGRGTDLHAAALAPVDLHRLGRLVVDFLIDTPARGTDRPEIAAHGDRTARVAFRAASNLLADAHRREVRILGQQRIDLGLVRVQDAGAVRSLACRWSIQLECRGHRVSRAAEAA